MSDLKLDISKLENKNEQLRRSPLLESPQRGRSPIPPNSPLLQPRTQSPLNSPRTQRRARDALRKLGSSMSKSSSLTKTQSLSSPKLVKVQKHEGARCGWKIMGDENDEALDQATIELVAEKIRGMELSGQIVPEFIAV